MRNIVIFSLLVLISCEQEIDGVLPGFEPQIVVTSFIRPDTTIAVFLTENVSVLSTKQPSSITGAQVSLYEDDVFIGSLEETTLEPTERDSPLEPLRGVYLLDYRPRIGSSYRLEVDHNDYPEVTATTEIPVQNSDFEVSLASTSIIRLDDIGDGIYFGLAEFVAKIKISDPEGKNYYSVGVLFETGNIVGEPVFNEAGEIIFCEIDRGLTETDFSSNSILFEQGESTGFENDGGEVFSDDLFNNDEFEFEITFRLPIGSLAGCGEYSENIERFFIEVRSLSVDYYQYIFTTTLQNSVLEDPFAEPVQIYDNVEGGLGIFGAYNFERFEFRLDGLIPD